MILVTGGVGTLGGPLVAALRRQTDHDVRVTGLEHQADVFSGVNRYVRCDVGDYRQLRRVVVDKLDLGPFDYVYHLAAEFGRLNGEDYYEQCWRTNVVGTKHLIRLQEERGFKVIFASSSEVYGEQGAPYLSEGLTEREPVRHLNDYAMSKWVNEQQFRNSRAQRGTESMILRFFNAYGPGEVYHPYRSVVCLFVHAALTRSPMVVYQGYHRVFMYVDDLVDTVAGAWTRFKSGAVYNVGGREYRSVEELAAVVLEASGAPASLVRLVPREEHNVVNKRPDITLAERDLGHDPKITIDVGVPLTVDWARRGSPR